MTREQKIERARELRAAGWTLAEIGAEFGVSESTALRWTDPEQAAKNRRQCHSYKNRNRDRMRDYAREYHATHKGVCSICGETTLHRGHDGGVCRSCNEAGIALRREIVAEMWAAGCTYGEIGRAVGITQGHLSMEIDRMRKAGYDLPHRRTPEQRARMCEARWGAA